MALTGFIGAHNPVDQSHLPFSVRKGDYFHPSLQRALGIRW